MVRRSWKVYGKDGHRQRMSFEKSVRYVFGDEPPRILEFDCSDKTGTNEYVLVHITMDDASACEAELYGQITDGYFENSVTGRVEEVFEQPDTNDRDDAVAVYEKLSKAANQLCNYCMLSGSTYCGEYCQVNELLTDAYTEMENELKKEE